MRTTLRLSQPITVLLAPNNYGKTNLLDAVSAAAMFVNNGPKLQERLKGNGYTSYNRESAKQFSFEIVFQHDNRSITYGFVISPGEGVEKEKLSVGHTTIINRAGEQAMLP